MTDMDIERRRLLELCGMGALYGGTGSIVAGESPRSHPEEQEVTLHKQTNRHPERAPLGPENIRVETSEGVKSLRDALFQDGDLPHGNLAGTTFRSTANNTQSDGPKAGLVVSTPEHGTLTPALGRGKSVPPDATLNIWAGAFEENRDSDERSMPVARPDTQLEVTVEKPDGRTEELSAESGKLGTSQVRYDLSSDDQSGKYIIKASHEDISRPRRAEFTVGPVATLVGPGFGEKRLSGRETTVVALVREGGKPIADTELSFSIEHEGESVTSETTQTDESGFATLSFTPEETGSYVVVLEREGQTVDSFSFQSVEATLVSNRQFTNGLAGKESFYAGYLYTADGPLTNTEFQLRFERDETYVDRTVETDENGFFSIRYELPDGLNEELEFSQLEIIAEMDGTNIVPMANSVTVNGLESDTNLFEQGPIQLDIEGQAENTGFFSQIVSSPGQPTTVTVTVRDGETPITDTDIDLAFQYGRAGPLVETRTVTTGDEGTATVSLDLPENAPNGAGLSVTARGQIDGETQTQNRTASIQRYNLPLLDTFPQRISGPGEEESVDLEATDLRTGEPAAEQYRQITYEHDTAFDGTFANVGLETGADGTDETTFEIPDDVQFSEQFRPHDIYSRGSLSLDVGVNHPGNLSIPETITPGETIDISFDVPGDQTATGFVMINNRSPSHSFGTTLTSGESTTLQIPEHAEDSSPLFEVLLSDIFEEPFLSVYVWARSTDGTLYGGRWRVSVEDSGSGDESGAGGSDGEDGSDSGGDGESGGEDDGTNNGGGDGTDTGEDDGDSGSDDGTDTDEDGSESGGEGTDTGEDNSGNGDDESGNDGSGDSGTDSSEDESGDGSGPGFGVVSGLAGLGVSGYLAAKRAGDDDTE